MINAAYAWLISVYIGSLILFFWQTLIVTFIALTVGAALVILNQLTDL